jgi:hypothetical protein
LILLEGKLDILCDLKTAEQPPGTIFPSWVPDYSLDSPIYPLRLVSRDGDNFHFAPTGHDNHLHVKEFHPSDTAQPYSLRLTGLKLDRICHLSVYSQPDEEVGKLINLWRDAIVQGPSLAEQLTPDVQSCLYYLSDILIEMFTELLGGKPLHSAKKRFKEEHNTFGSLYNFVSQKYVLDAFVHMLFCGRLSNNSEKNDKLSLERLMQLLDIEEPEDPSIELLRACFTRLSMATRYRCSAVTEDGYIGAVPYHTKLGDVAVILYGCSVPVILRPREEVDTYEFIGECYLHTFMDVGAVALQISKTFAEGSFILV